MIRKLSQAVGNCSTGGSGPNGSSFHNGRMRFKMSGLVWVAMKQIQGRSSAIRYYSLQAAAFLGRLPFIVIVVRYTSPSAEVSASTRLPGVCKAKNKMGQKPSIVLSLRFEVTEFFKPSSSIALKTRNTRPRSCRSTPVGRGSLLEELRLFGLF